MNGFMTKNVLIYGTLTLLGLCLGMMAAQSVDMSRANERIKSLEKERHNLLASSLESWSRMQLAEEKIKKLKEEDMGLCLFIDLDKDGRPVDHKWGKEVIMLKVGGKFIYPDWIDKPRVEGPSDQMEKLWLERDPRVFHCIYSNRVLAKFPRG